ncbi:MULTISPECIES: DnaD domain protein [Carboxydocella]|uniref:DNA replication protein n=2 Tax=Carboxydocella TaxID=178898 RepID=A0A1T4QS34_9FIRM|nr:MULTISPECIES: DnaD domain protein [Carboxydocella]AVX20828.1 DNA replication protein DnaD [Carboxydocella thermautotrophica]AVX31247.1 DNA replication protein DnaD [Carboxydocella thermautotrophica]SKA06504.1 DNA replication protein [Carboxydocella sporoproducens DSM 16521]GAW30002.1 primosomal protein DnaI [Carboxydocella sp. ULO1]GAW30395.1 primosomal protein DnaI [Carboxydocella sp. JDF658]
MDINITASFAAELTGNGNISIPALLLKGLGPLDITPEQFLVITLLLYFRQQQNFFPTSQELSELSGLSETTVQQTLATLIEKKLLSIKPKFIVARQALEEEYSLEPLYQALVSIWAIERKQELAAIKQKLLEDQKQDLVALGRLFEQEFGRPLSAMEMDQIANWVITEGYEQDLVVEALKRGILRGVRNLKYIDKILLDWRNRGLDSLAKVKAFEEQIARQKLGGKERIRKEKPVEPAPDSKYEQVWT